MSIESIPGWCTFDGLYRDAVRAARDGDVLVEVGVAFGRSAASMGRAILDSSKRLTFYAVDPMIDDADSGAPTWGIELAPWARSEGGPFNAFASSMRAYARAELEHVRLVRAPSTMAARMFDDQSLALVFLDGAHDEQSVTADIEAWLPKLKPGAVIAGDDFHEQFPGVIAAVRGAFPLGGFEVRGRIWKRTIPACAT